MVCPSSEVFSHTTEVGGEVSVSEFMGRLSSCAPELKIYPVKRAETGYPALTSVITMRSLLVLFSLVGHALAQGFNVQGTVEAFPRIPGLGKNVTTLHLSELGSTDEFTSLVHPKFPHHQVRVKKTKFCDPTVKFVYRLSKGTRPNPRRHVVSTPDTSTSMLARNTSSSTSSRVAAIQKKVNTFIVSCVRTF